MILILKKMIMCKVDLKCDEWDTFIYIPINPSALCGRLPQNSLKILNFPHPTNFLCGRLNSPTNVYVFP